jgi:hypothetical protein
MEEEIIEGWVKIYETYDFMLAELIEAKFHDETIEYQLMNKADIGSTMAVGNAKMGREAVGIPLKFFVKPEDAEKALALINEDKSKMIDDPNLDFNNNSSDTPTDK